MAGGTTLGLGLMELGARVAGFVPGVEFRIKVGPYVAAPNQTIVSRTSEWDVQVRTNKAGYREDPMAEDTASRWVVALGDSFTMGFNVDVQNTFVQQLESSLRGSGMNVNVVNAGMVSSQPKIYRQLYRGRFQADPRVTDVILGFYLGNDIIGPESADEFIMSDAAQHEPALYRFKVILSEHSSLYGLVNNGGQRPTFPLEACRDAGYRGFTVV
jgi:hypothetical protein